MTDATALHVLLERVRTLQEDHLAAKSERAEAVQELKDMLREHIIRLPIPLTVPQWSDDPLDLAEQFSGTLEAQLSGNLWKRTAESRESAATMRAIARLLRLALRQ